MTESIMVMIPLLITFLGVLQVSTGVLARTVMSNRVQGSVAFDALAPASSNMTLPLSQINLSNGAPANTSDPNSTVTLTRVELPGGGAFTFGLAKIRRPSVSPLLPGGDNFEATGLALTE